MMKPFRKTFMKMFRKFIIGLEVIIWPGKGLPSIQIKQKDNAMDCSRWRKLIEDVC